MLFDVRSVRHAYETIADTYEQSFADDLEKSSFDRRVLDDAFASVPTGSLVLDVGCGPAQVAGRLRKAGFLPIGFDLTWGMLAIARRRHPGVPLVCGDFLNLPLGADSIGGAVAWFALHNLPRELLPPALNGIRRVLRLGSPFVIATHAGRGEEFVEHEWEGSSEAVVLTYYEVDELETMLDGAQLQLREVRQRAPLAHEHPVTKLFLSSVAS